MVTALTVGLLKNLTERLHETPPFELEPGRFRLDFRDLGIEGGLLVDAYEYAMRGLAESYPDNIRFVED